MDSNVTRDLASLQGWLFELGRAYERALSAREPLKREAETAFMALLAPIPVGAQDDPQTAFNEWVGKTTGKDRANLLRALPTAVAAAAANRQHVALNLFIPAVRRLGVSAKGLPQLTDYLISILAARDEAERARSTLQEVVIWLVESLPTPLLRERLRDWPRRPGWTARLSWAALEGSRDNAAAMRGVLSALSSSIGDYLLSLSPVPRRGVIDNLFRRLSFAVFSDVLASLQPEEHRRLFEAFFFPRSGLEPPEPVAHANGVEFARIRFQDHVTDVRPVRRGPGQLSWGLSIAYIVADAAACHPSVAAATKAGKPTRSSMLEKAALEACLAEVRDVYISLSYHQPANYYTVSDEAHVSALDEMAALISSISIQDWFETGRL